ncbi:PaaI family thioesterase [Tistrella mobilis]|uniref:PaaI family thioesterase n=1 Tax=Tistrella mobilis TaxID=171437 RepID=UPI0035582D13
MTTGAAHAHLANIFKNVPIAKSMGLSLTYDEAGNAVVSMPRNPGFDHGMKDTHGGVLAAMLDSAGWFTAAAQCSKMVLTSDLHVRMLQGARQQDLTATARIIRAGSKLIVAEMALHSADGELVATGSASFAVLGDLPVG